MPSLKELRIRKKSVTSTHKMTSAMKMVSSVKFNRAQAQWRTSLIALNHAKDWASRLLVHREECRKIPLFLRAPDPALPLLLIVLTSDRGLCGGFNQRLLKAVHTFVIHHQNQGRPVQLISVGQRGTLPLQRSHFQVIEAFTQLGAMSYEDIMPLTTLIISLFKERRISQCMVLYNAFHNALRQDPHFVPLLPLHLDPHPQGELIDGGLLSYGPDIEALFESVLDLLLHAQCYSIFQEHLVSENGARMMAMDTATENAEEIMQNLKLTYDRLRQSLITKELIEIISGANAL